MNAVVETTTLHNKEWKTYQRSKERKMDKKEQREFQYAWGNEIFHWPEFLAFAKRLNINTTLPIQNVTIDLPCDNLASITLRYSGEDTQKIEVESSKE